MDYLLSLVGQDQDTITEAIKELAENGQKVKFQEKEIDDLKNEVDEAREQIHYLNKKIDQKYDVIDDLEHDLDKVDEKFNITKKELESKENEYKELEKFASEKLEEIEILRDNNLSMVSQISENVRMEEKLKIQNKIINKLKDELREKSEFQYQQEDLQKLIDDIEHLKNINEEKEAQIADVAKENEQLKVKLVNIEIEEEGLSLQHESLMRKYMCGECDKDFENGLSLKFHMKSVHEDRDTKLMKLKMKLFEIGGKISEQKLELTKKFAS